MISLIFNMESSKGRNELKTDIRNKLQNGWALLMGNNDTISIIEHEIFPPETEKNTEFVAYLIPQQQDTIGFYIVKKTNEFYEFLGKPPDWDKTVILEVGEIRNKRVGFGQHFSKTGDKFDEGIEFLLNGILEDGEV